MERLDFAKRAAILGLLSIGGVALLAGHQVQDPATEIMWRKLDLSHAALDALVLDDFEALEAYAEDLEALATAGVEFILDTEEYRAEARAFRAAATAMKRAAVDRDADAGTLAYWDLTLTCIRCHRSLDVVPR